MTNQRANEKKSWTEMSLMEKCRAVLYALDESADPALEHRVLTLERKLQTLQADAHRSGGAS